MSCDLPAEWDSTPLGEIIKVHHGFAFKGEYFADGPPGDILVTPGNFKIGGGFSLQKTKYYRGPVDDRYVLPQGALVISMTDLSKASDTLGSPAICPQPPDEHRLLHNQRIGLVEVLDTARSDIGFVYASLRTEAYRRQIVAGATGTTVKHTSPSRIYDAIISMPPPDEQRRIAAVLGGLDDKIDSNRRIATLLDEIAGVAFARWSRARSDSPHVPLSECVDLKLGGTPSRKNPAYWEDGTVAWIASGKANEFRILTPSEWITQEAVAQSATKLLPAGTTVVAITGATMGKVSRLEIDACANQSIIGLIGNDVYPDALLYYWLKSSVDELLKRQTGAAQQHVNKQDVGSLPIPQLDRDAAREVNAVLHPLVAKVHSLLSEVETLTAIRDELLPKLVSGAIRVPPGSEDHGAEALVA